MLGRLETEGLSLFTLNYIIVYKLLDRKPHVGCLEYAACIFSRKVGPLQKWVS